LLVTHEQEEAFDLADRIALLHLGRLEQLGTPESLYDTPATPFVAGFVGRASQLRGVVTGWESNNALVRAAGAEWHARAPDGITGDVELLLRPEAIRFARTGALAGTVIHRRFAGAMAFYTVRLAGGEELEVAAPADAVRDGDAVRLEPTGSGAHAWSVAPQ
jgi:ABC-type Fe3+/spermidine/putrescine transport system ATPase subunit